jgi:hypothetical protein
MKSKLKIMFFYVWSSDEDRGFGGGSFLTKIPNQERNEIKKLR